MPAAVPIPKTYSRPADTGAPSLLTSLPTELRLSVFEALFKRDKPVLLHNAPLYHAIQPELSGNDSPDELRTAQEQVDEIFEKEIGADTEFKHHFNEGLSLLLSCRQIYHECVGILYGNNAFVLSRATDRCDDPQSGFHARATNTVTGADYVHLSYVGEWLHNLGTQRALLSRVSLDVDALCPLNCDNCWNEFDLLPLLNMIWRHHQCSISFVRTGRILKEHPRDAAAEQERDEIAEKLNNILHALAVADVLNLKRYAPFPRILASIDIKSPFDLGRVWYNGAHSKEPSEYRDVHRPFSISENGLVIQLRERAPHQLQQLKWRKSEPSFLDLPTGAQRRIYSYVGRDSGGITLDLDEHRVSGFPMHLLQICREARHKLALGCALTSDVPKTIVATSRDIVTDFPTLSALEGDLSPANISDAFHTLLSGWSTPAGQPHHLTIELRLRPTSAILLADTRIDIKRLIPFFKYGCSSKAMLRVHMSFPTPHGTYEDSAQILLERLFRQLFLVLSDMLEQWPDNAPHHPNQHGTIPTITMTGRCEILHASFAATATTPAMTVQNRHHKLSATELLRRGYRIGAKLDEACGPAPNGYRPRYRGQKGSAYGLWQDLLRRWWSDLYSKRLPELPE